MKRILINANLQDEIRVAIVEDNLLCDLDTEKNITYNRQSNIYKGVVTRVESSLDAAFIDYGSDRHGFLPFKELSKNFVVAKLGESFEKQETSIKDVLKEGDEIVVQVQKEERGNKGVSLTNQVSIAANSIVIMPNSSMSTGGISRKISDDKRQEVKDLIPKLQFPDEFGFIIRTSIVDKDIKEVQQEVDYLYKLWKSVEAIASSNKAPFLIYKDSNIYTRCFRDYLRSDVEQIIIDDHKAFQKCQETLNSFYPEFIDKVIFYNEKIPLFTKYNVENAIQLINKREVPLVSGGILVIDSTEALISIDVNSSKATKGSDIEETALNTNIEATNEIARQLRLRDIGGLIVIDFIDMSNSINQRKVESTLIKAIKLDKARVQVGKISKFGLLEMSRQRLRSALEDNSNEICTKCNGMGTVKSVNVFAINVIRHIEQEVAVGAGNRVIAQIPIEVATYILNEMRQIITNIESNYQKEVVIIPNRYFEIPQIEIKSFYFMPQTAQTKSHDIKIKIPNVELNTKEEVKEEIPAIRNIKVEHGKRDSKNKGRFKNRESFGATLFRLITFGIFSHKKQQKGNQQNYYRGKQFGNRKRNISSSSYTRKNHNNSSRTRRKSNRNPNYSSNKTSTL